MAENMQELPKLPANVYDYLQIADATAFRFSKRIQLATQMNVMGLFASESYQIANYGIGISPKISILFLNSAFGKFH